VTGGLTDASGFDSSSVRNGLLPGAIIVSASTTQDGVDLTAVFGAYPGINSASVGALNANNGGNATALGTAGVDFRKTYVTAGTAQFGTIKLGRDIGLFGQDAILNDQTLLGVGATGGNADPGNTSLGRIGFGYIYTDFMPQITYISPIFAGFQASLGVFQPLNSAGIFTGGLSGSSSEHSAPMIQGRLTYDYKAPAWSVHLWTGGLEQQLDDVVAPYAPALNNGTKTGIAGEVGGVVTVGPVGLTAYYYRAHGVGTTGEFFEAIGANGQLRDSEGGYIQGSWKATDKLKLIGSYGVSNLYLANGEAASETFEEFLPTGPVIVDPAAALVRRNESETAGAYYSMTDWLTLVGEYTHTDSKAHGPNASQANSVSAGAILFY
jgi:predicted porin